MFNTINAAKLAIETFFASVHEIDLHDDLSPEERTKLKATVQVQLWMEIYDLFPRSHHYSTLLISPAMRINLFCFQKFVGVLKSVMRYQFGHISDYDTTMASLEKVLTEMTNQIEKDIKLYSKESKVDRRAAYEKFTRKYVEMAPPSF